MCALQSGDVEVGSIARWNCQTCAARVSGVAEISSAGGRTNFSATGVQNAQASSTFILGQTTTPRKIENDGAGYCVIMGATPLNSFSRGPTEKMLTSKWT